MPDLPALPNPNTAGTQEYLRFVENLRRAIPGLEMLEKLLQTALISDHTSISVLLRELDERPKAKLFAFGFVVAGIHEGKQANIYVVFFTDETVELRFNNHQPQTNTVTLSSWMEGYRHALVHLRDFLCFAKQILDIAVPEP